MADMGPLLARPIVAGEVGKPAVQVAAAHQPAEHPYARQGFWYGFA
jgi:hypothetical protein